MKQIKLPRSSLSGTRFWHLKEETVVVPISYMPDADSTKTIIEVVV